MPEALALPGIDDPAPAATGASPPEPAAPPASAEVVVTPPQESVAADPNAPPEGETPQQKAQRKRGPQDRINELVHDREEARRESAELRGMMRSLIENVRSGQVSATDARAAAGITGAESPPDEKQFSNWQDFLVAKAAYQARQDLRAELGRAAQTYQQHEQQRQQHTRVQQVQEATVRLHDTLGGQMREAAASYSDYADVVGAAVDELPINVEAAMAVSGAGGHVAYYLAQHPELVKPLSQLSDLELGHTISRIAHAMRGSASSSAAPPPGRPVGGRGSAPLDYPANATPEQHKAWRARAFPQPKRA